jgi:hypothetical protein
MGSPFLKVNRFSDEVIRFAHLDHGFQETALAVFTLELALASGNGNSRVAASLVLIADHAGEIEGDL